MSVAEVVPQQIAHAVAVAVACQRDRVRGWTLRSPLADNAVAPLINQIEISPAVSRQTMSLR
jgi:hypothetical protein